MMRIKTVKTEKPVLPLIFLNKFDCFLRAPGGLVKLRRRPLFHIGTDFLSLQSMPVLPLGLKPLGVGIFLPVRLGMVRP